MIYLVNINLEIFQYLKFPLVKEFDVYNIFITPVPPSIPHSLGLSEAKELFLKNFNLSDNVSRIQQIGNKLKIICDF